MLSFLDSRLALHVAADDAANLLHVLSHEDRLIILHRLLEHSSLSLSELQHLTHLAMNTLQSHLTTLCNQGILSAVNRNDRVHYQMVDTRATQIMRLLDTLHFNQNESGV